MLTILPGEVIRATEEEEVEQVHTVENVHKTNTPNASNVLDQLKRKAITNDNLFDCLMETVKTCTLGQITNALYEVGGKYRRNM